MTDIRKGSFIRTTVLMASAHGIQGMSLTTESVYLEVLFDFNLTNFPHINELRKSASRAVGFVIRSCKEVTEISLTKTL